MRVYFQKKEDLKLFFFTASNTKYGCLFYVIRLCILTATFVQKPIE